MQAQTWGRLTFTHTLCTGTNLTQQICFTEEERILQNGKLYAQNHLAGEWRNSRLPIRFLKALTPVTWCCSQAQQQKPAKKLIALCLVQNFCSPYFILIPWTGLICVMQLSSSEYLMLPNTYSLTRLDSVHNHPPRQVAIYSRQEKRRQAKGWILFVMGQWQRFL